jgi:apolipoprotein D and lipocalin family protein
VKRKAPRPDFRRIGSCTLIFALAALSACAGRQPEMETVDYVDLPRFMGDWYVVANIPTFVEKGAHNAVESYELNPDGTIATTFRFSVGGFDGEAKEYKPTGFIRNTETNALWGMQFVWPFKGDYRIVYLDDEYTQTIIGRQKRDFVWIMARTPTLPGDDYERLLQFCEALGYDRAQIRKVPQRWP